MPRATTFCLAAIPLIQLAWWAIGGNLGINPVETIQHHTGQWGLRLLLLTLAMTPLRNVLGKPWPIQIRRQLGLWSFTYLSLHFASYLVFDLAFDPVALADDLVKRSFITAGFLAWLLLLPLAATSTRGWQRRLGRRWKRLHQLVYVASTAGCVHFVWKSKVEETEPFVYLAVLLLLLSLRHPVLRRRTAGRLKIG